MILLELKILMFVYIQATERVTNCTCDSEITKNEYVDRAVQEKKMKTRHNTCNMQESKRQDSYSLMHLGNFCHYNYCLVKIYNPQ